MGFKQRRPRGAIGCEAISSVFVIEGSLLLDWLQNPRLVCCPTDNRTAKLSGDRPFSRRQMIKTGDDIGHLGSGYMLQPAKGRWRDIKQAAC